MSIPSGWAEFNDANAVIRGRIVAASGTFSGTFSSDNIDAVKDLNIRGNAVSAYYGFAFAKGSKAAELVIPAQPYARVAEIVVPISIISWGKDQKKSDTWGKVAFYRNGQLIASNEIYVPTDGDFESEGDWVTETMYSMQVVRIIDFDVSVTSSATYKVVFTDGQNWSGGTTIGMLGSVVVGCRKR